MKKSIILILFFIVSNSVIFAQRANMREMEVMVGGGPNMFFCDIGDGGLGPVGFIAARYYEHLPLGLILMKVLQISKEIIISLHQCLKVPFWSITFFTTPIL